MKFILFIPFLLLLQACSYKTTSVPVKECEYETSYKTAHQGGVYTYVVYKCNVVVSTPTQTFDEKVFKQKTNLTNESIVQY